MSKSLGNVVDPSALINSRFHGDPDPLRYFLLRSSRIDGDGQFSGDALEGCYNRELVGSLGNLISRVFSNPSKEEEAGDERIDEMIVEEVGKYTDRIPALYDNVQFHAVADCLQELLAAGNRLLSLRQQWRDENQWPVCRQSIRALFDAAIPGIEPIIPGTAQRIRAIIDGSDGVGKGGIFPRLQPPGSR